MQIAVHTIKKYETPAYNDHLSMLNTKERIFVLAYSVCLFNFTALIFYGFELLEPKGIIELFMFVAAGLAWILVTDLHKYNKELRVKDPAGEGTA